MTRAALLAAMLAVAQVPVASAQPQPDNRALAASHFKQGQLYYNNKDYDRAIAEYRAAYELSKEPLLLFNIALCEDRANRPERALDLFQQYLERAPDGEVADEARENVVRLTPIVEEIRAKRNQDAAAREEAQRREAEARRAEEAKRAAERAAREAQAQREVSGIEHRAKLERWGAYAAGGLGLVSLGVGALYGMQASSNADAINSHTMGAWTDDLLAKEAEGKSASTKMVVFTSIGGVFVVGGAVLYWFAHRTEARAHERRVELLATPMPGGAAAGVTLRF